MSIQTRRYHVARKRSIFGVYRWGVFDVIGRELFSYMLWSDAVAKATTLARTVEINLPAKKPSHAGEIIITRTHHDWVKIKAGTDWIEVTDREIPSLCAALLRHCKEAA